MNQTMIVNKNNLADAKIIEAPLAPLEQGEVRLSIEKFALTTNNITYAVTGDTIGYWQFFPAEPPYGIVPAWGFATVTEAQNEQIQTGKRVYGFFPMSRYLTVAPGRIREEGFMDFKPHRRELPAIYNFYPFTDHDPSYQAEYEDYLPALRPLFMTSFLNYHFLKDEAFFEAEQIVITSASSKTGLGLAGMLKKNQPEDNRKIIALTSERNVDFVEKTGLYDLILSYQDIEQRLPQKPATIVDMAGNSDLLFSLHDLLGDDLKYISLIGLTDWTAFDRQRKAPRSKFFFAPTYAAGYFERWGQNHAQEMISRELFSFIKNVSDWMDLAYISGYSNLQKLFSEMAGGKVNPGQAIIFDQS